MPGIGVDRKLRKKLEGHLHETNLLDVISVLSDTYLLTLLVKLTPAPETIFFDYHIIYLSL